MKKLLLLSFLFISFVGCKKDKLSGEGPLTVEARPEKVQQGNIQSVRVSGSQKVMIVHGDVYDLEVKGYSNLVRSIKTEVYNNTLVIEYPGIYNVINDNVVVTLTIPQMPNVSVSGTSRTTVIGNYPDKENLKFQLSGSGNIVAGIGNVNNLEINISGSGDIDASNFIANKVNAFISGSGEIRTTALNNLKATISGSGNIKYFGNPIIDSSTSGSGRVVKAQ